MIPTVEDILRDLAAGKIGFEQAMAWMEEHFRMAMEEASSPPEYGESLCNAAANWNEFIDPLNSYCAAQPDFEVIHEGGPDAACKNIIALLEKRLRATHDEGAGEGS